MSLISKTSITDGSTIDASDVNSPLDTIYNDYNGNIDGNNIASTANISVANVTASGSVTATTSVISDTFAEKTAGAGVTMDSFAIKDGVPKNWNGWITPDETWTYASASTFIVPGDQTTKYTIGTILKWTQTTVKYGIVSSSSYSSPNTTVTIVVNTDYTIANAVITNNYYSYSTMSQGYVGAIYNPYKFAAHKTSSQNISDATPTDVTWTEVYDTSGDFDGTSYTAPITGYYHFSSTFLMNSGGANAGVNFAAYILRSDSKRITYSSHATSTGHSEFSASMSADTYMTAGQSVKCVAYIDTTSGTPLVYADSNYTNVFSGHLISI